MDNNLIENNLSEKKKCKLTSLHTYTIIAIVVLIAFSFCWILPAGEFDRVYDEATDSEMVIPGSFHFVEKDAPGIFDMFIAVQRGYVDMAGIIFFVMFAYAFVYLLTANGTLDALIGAMLRRLKDKVFLIIPVSMIGFGLMGSVAGLYEEVYGLVPVFIGIALALGYDAVVGGAIAMTGIATGFAAAIINPFSLGIAQGIAEVPLYSGIGFRVITFIVFEAIAITYVMIYAKKVKANPEKSVVYGIELPGVKVKDKEVLINTKFTKIHVLSCIISLTTLIMILVTTLLFGWYIDELAGLFLMMMIILGFVSKKTFGQIMDEYIIASQDILFGIMTIGFIRAAVILMEDSRILDTITNFFANILMDTSSYVAGIGMLIVQHLVNLFIAGAPAQAVATMPIMAPLSDLININRQIAVQSYVFGSGFASMLWPTQVAIDCAIMGIPIMRWYKFIVPLIGILAIFEVIFMVIAIAINYS